MSKRKKFKRMVRKWDDPILSQVCREVGDKEDTTALERLMRDVLASYGNGAGLAAPQIGRPLRAILAGDAFIVNPAIVDHSPNQVAGEEGCLSYPGVFATVFRWEWVAFTSRGRGVTKIDGFTAVVLQHEVDHLDGICLVGNEWRRQMNAAVHKQECATT